MVNYSYCATCGDPVDEDQDYCSLVCDPDPAAQAEVARIANLSIDELHAELETMLRSARSYWEEISR